MNGEDLRAPVAEALDLVVAVAAGELDAVPAIAARLGPWRVPLEA
jgi:hypothetical protein